MNNIKRFSRKKFHLKQNIWNINIISIARAYNLPHDAFIPIDIKKFNYEFEKRHNLLSVSEESENYSYS